MVKNNKIKTKRIINEDMTNIRNMFILLVIVVIVVIGLYYLTEHLVNTDKVSEEKTEAVIDYDIASIGTMFNRIEDEYYVLIYSKESNGKDLDDVLLNYRSSDGYIKTYFIDLDKKINESAKGEETVKKPTNSNEVKVNGATMYRIKNSVVVNCYCGVEEIKKVFE